MDETQHGAWPTPACIKTVLAGAVCSTTPTATVDGTHGQTLLATATTTTGGSCSDSNRITRLARRRMGRDREIREAQTSRGEATGEWKPTSSCIKLEDLHRTHHAIPSLMRIAKGGVHTTETCPLSSPTKGRRAKRSRRGGGKGPEQSQQHWGGDPVVGRQNLIVGIVGIGELQKAVVVVEA